MIYCVVPPELEEELYEHLRERYRDNPNVEVIIDRRSGPDRRGRGAPDPEVEDKRETRDRRRRRVPGVFPPTDVPDA